GPAISAPRQTEGAFVMPDGARLPYRAWLSPSRPWAVVLALHGFNDSRDAWEYPAPQMAEAGVTVFAPDQRGFGAAPGRGLWPGTETLVDDARTMARLVQARYPHTPLFLMGESMGGAVLILLATSPDPPPAAGYVLVAPAVWGRAEMNLFIQAALWGAATFLPGVRVTGHELPLHIRASDNMEALIRLSDDPLTIRRTRFDTIMGLVNLMDAAQRAAPRFHAPALFLYGGKDQLVPGDAMRAFWRTLPAGERLAYYPQGYHLLLRDLARALPLLDILSWMRHPDAPLPSGADRAAARWLARPPARHGPANGPAISSPGLSPGDVSRYAVRTDP
ncbi:MAG: alpha/beta fold hydrolase, partial [Acetobacteraceae bacterium]|nr:alpha/beta fold hydrolase [Acetobacteraceae bacterium]